MMYRFRWAQIPVLFVLLSLLASLAAAAPSGGIGVVDLNVVTSNYIGAKTAYTRLQDYANNAYAQVDILQKGIGLSPNDWTLFKGLIRQPAPDTVKIKELEDRALANIDECRTLAKKAEKSDAEKARFAELQGYIEPAGEEHDQMVAEIDNNCAKEQQWYQDCIASQLDLALSKIAQEQKLSVVVSKNVLSERGAEKIVLWNDKNVDITDKIVDYLNKNYKPALLDRTQN